MTTEGKQRPLRAVSPALFHYITETLEEDNIHSYDIQASSIETKDGLEVFIQYGENFKQSQSEFFSFASIEQRGEAIDHFTKEIAEACKETMIADYFKMMKM